MADPNKGRFTINGSPSEDPSTGDRQYTATHGQTLEIELELPDGVLAYRAQLYDPLDPDSPVASLDAPLRTWVENGQASITAAPTATVSVTMPNSDPLAVSYILRVRAQLGAAGEHIFERGVAVLDQASGLRKTVPSESIQFLARGWSDPINEMVDGVGAGGGGGGGTGFASGETSETDFEYVGNAIWIEPGTYNAADCIALMGTAAAGATFVVRLVRMSDTIPVALWTSTNQTPQNETLPSNLVVATAGFFRAEMRIAPATGADTGILHGIKLPL